MTTKRRFQLKLFCALNLSLTLSVTAATRTWTDTENRSMEAELIRVENGEAVFRKLDGIHYRFTLSKLSEADQQYIQENQATATATAEPVAQSKELPETKLTKWLDNRLVANDGKRVKRARESALPQAQYIAFYFSASWCPPCKKFTPNHNPKTLEFFIELSLAKQ